MTGKEHKQQYQMGQKAGVLTNDASLPPLTIAALYKIRWQVELFTLIRQSEPCQGEYAPSPMQLLDAATRVTFITRLKIRI